MATGNQYVGLAPQYEDYSSLKKYIRKNEDTWDKMNLIRFTRNQAGTAGVVEIEEKGGQTIAFKGKTGLTLVVASDVNDNAYDTHTVHIRYITTTGTKGYCSAIYDPTATTTEVAFTDDATGLIPVTDFYMPDTETYGTLAVVSSVAVQAGDNVCIGVTGVVAGIADPDICFIKILAAATSPTLANCHGVGSLWGRSETDHLDCYGSIMTMDYVTPWGLVVEGATCTIDGANSETEIKWFKSNGTDYVMDYYRTRTLSIDVAGTTNTHSLQICDYDNAAIYGVIEELLYEAYFSRYMCPVGRDAWFAHFCISQAIATVLDCYMTITITSPYGETSSHTCDISIPNNAISQVDPLFRLAELSEISFTVKGNLSNNSFDFHIIEAVQH